uniref:Uncharacterized protein n=1 Tax=Anopheles christyi TaxID=43041 RepID=A0A182K8S9_9DIPT
MREKDHSPRKMLPSPKQGAVYPLLGLGSTLPAPFDLSLVNRSSSSNLLHQQQQQHQSLAEQPLDLRVERKKSSVGGGGGGGTGGNGGTSTSTSSDDETDPPRASSTDSKPGSNVIFFNDNNNNSNNLNNNHSKQPSDSDKSPSPTNHHNNNNNNNNSSKYTNNNHINIKDEFRISSLANHSPSALFSGPPGLNPLMLEAIAKAGLPLPYRGSFLPPRSSASYDLQRLKEREALAVSLSQLRQNASNSGGGGNIRSFMGKVTQLPIPLRLQHQQQQQQQSPSAQSNAGGDSPYGRRSSQTGRQQNDGHNDTHSSRSSTPSDEEPVSPAGGSIGSPQQEQDIKMETNNNEDGDEPLQVT